MLNTTDVAPTISRSPTPDRIVQPSFFSCFERSSASCIPVLTLRWTYNNL